MADPINLNQVGPRLNLRNIKNINVPFELATDNGEVNFYYKPGNKDIFVIGFNVEMIDADGKLVGINDTLRDDIRLMISDNDGKSYEVGPIPISAFDRIMDSRLFQGWYIDHQIQYTFTLNGQNAPGKGAYPLIINLTLIGYELD